MLKNDERRNVRFRIRRMIAGSGKSVGEYYDYGLICV